jgi:hypothetical protein
MFSMVRTIGASTLVVGILTAVGVHAQVVQSVDPTDHLFVFDFESVPNTSSPWTPYATISDPGFVIGERLVGQMTSSAGGFDVVSGAPAIPLAIDDSVPATQSVSVFEQSGDTRLAAEGPLGWPDPDSLGEGAFSVLFDSDQAIIGFDIGNCNLDDQISVSFYASDGALLTTLSPTYPNHPSCGTSGEKSLVFAVEGGPGIAAITVNTTDPGGLAYDDLRYCPGECSSPDTDCDQVCQDVDNCLEVQNFNQCDTDGDGYGNACDGDFDNDGLVGVPDFNTFRTGFGQPVTAENEDLDSNCDGFIGIPDLNAFRSQFMIGPGP